MNNKLNDIFKWLDKKIDLSNIFHAKKISIKHNYKKWTNDIQQNLDNLDIRTNIYIKIQKNKTDIFDNFIKNKKLAKNINISNKLNIFELQKRKLENIILSLKKKLKKRKKKKNISIYKNKIIKISYILLFIIIFLWINSYIVQNRIKSWYEKIISIKNNSWDLEYIKKTINNAKFDFIIADIFIKPLQLIPNQNIKNWYYLLKWWKNLTNLLDSWIQSYESINKLIINKWWIQNIEITNLLKNFQWDFNNLNNLLYKVILSYNNIKSLWNKDLDNKLNNIKNKLISFYKISNTIDKNYSDFLALLWDKKEKKYLVLFQNNDEIRPTWWFIWSLATIWIYKWKIKYFNKEDVYAYEWEINKVYKNKKPAPEWLNKITKTFWLRDANYFINFDNSSKSINFFLEKIWKKVDWIIYLNQNLLLDFLKLTWPIKFSDIWETIDENNFSLIISTLVEAQSFKVWTLWTPKKILFDFANIFIDKLLTEKKYFSYLDIILKNFKTRDLVIYSFNSNENNLLWKLWLNWRINYWETLDFNYPVYTSIWWNKSDRYIKIKYKKYFNINPDCSIDTKLEIYRSHFFSKFEEKKVNELLDKHPIKDKTRKDIINIQWRWVNKEYVRVVLPKNIIIKPKKGIKIHNFKNTTVVDFYMNTRVWETVNFIISYKILNKSCESYSFKLYKQPWIRNYELYLINWNKTIYNNIIYSDFNYKKQD